MEEQEDDEQEDEKEAKVMEEDEEDVDEEEEDTEEEQTGESAEEEEKEEEDGRRTLRMAGNTCPALPVRSEMAAVTSCRSNSVRPHDGHDTYSVFVLRMRDPWRRGESTAEM